MKCVRFCLILFLLSSSIFASAKDVERDLRKLNNLPSCISFFQNVLKNKLQTAKKNCLDKAQTEIAEFYVLLELWKDAPEQDFEKAAWNLYPKFVNVYSALDNFSIHINENFRNFGYVQGMVDQKINEEFLCALKAAKSIPFLREDCDPNYLSSSLGYEIEERLNKSHTYCMLEEGQLNSLQAILNTLAVPIAECLGTPWRISSIRAWKTSTNAEDFGPNEWHTDGLPPSALKIMYYPLGIDEERGTIEIQTPNGSQILRGEPGTWLFFKNSEILHRAIAPKTGERIAVEITILPSLSYDLKPICAGVNARHPRLPWQKSYCAENPTYKEGEVSGVNIGGGPYWNSPKWVNLEEVTSPLNTKPFYLFPNCIFPFTNRSVPCVYTSHALEHLNISTVYRALSESQRILKKNGDLIIKIPDYDRALTCWKNNDPSFFGDEWNIQSVSHLWSMRNICDCLDHRAAMIFCSFFNDAYGNPFGASSQSNLSKAYFGPPTLDIPSLRTLIQNRTPSEIAKELRKAICMQETDFRFCHQSAWSREELKVLLNEFGFELVSFDPGLICSAWKNIPGIDEMKNISTFCWARKK